MPITSHPTKQFLIIPDISSGTSLLQRWSAEPQLIIMDGIHVEVMDGDSFQTGQARNLVRYF